MYHAQVPETRLRRYRAWAPQSYLVIKERALTQRFTILSRERYGTDLVPEEKVVMAGSTGNVYTQRIGLQPRCNCPHAKGGNQCKHIIYVMLRVLRAREEIAYQLALTSSELRELFWNAPPIPSAEADSVRASDEQDGNRKPIEGDCPICYDDLQPGKDAIVYCKTGCGNNIHKSCMRKWDVRSREETTCPCCRAVWNMEDGSEDNLGRIDLNNLPRNEEGYVNIAEELGLRDPMARHLERFGERPMGYSSSRNVDAYNRHFALAVDGEVVDEDDYDYYYYNDFEDDGDDYDSDEENSLDPEDPPWVQDMYYGGGDFDPYHEHNWPENRDTEDEFEDDEEDEEDDESPLPPYLWLNYNIHNIQEAVQAITDNENSEDSDRSDTDEDDEDEELEHFH